MRRLDHEGKLKALVAAGERGAAVKYFMRDMVSVPAPFVLDDAAHARHVA